MNFKRKLLTVLLVLMVASIAYGQTGTIDVAWDAVSNVEGYDVYHWKSNDAPTITDVGNVTSYQLTGLLDSTTWSVCVRAYWPDPISGNKLSSVNCSNTVVGWPRPRIDNVTVQLVDPRPGDQASEWSAVVDGANFQPGAAFTALAESFFITQVTSLSPTQAGLLFEWAGVGSDVSDLEVMNPDRVYQLSSGALRVVGSPPPSDVQNLRRGDTKPLP